MPLPYQVESLDKVEESMQSLYVEKDGAYVLDVEGAPDVSGLKSKNNELLGKMKSQKDTLAELERKLGAYGGADPDEIKTLMDRFKNDEEARMIAEGKTDEVINRRMERFQKEADRKIQEAEERAKKASSFADKFRDKVLADSIKDAALKAGAHPEAMEDFVLRAKSLFQINEDGEAVAMQGDDPLLGKDGKTPLSPLEWAESLRETAPHLWPKASGTGAKGGDGSGIPKSYADCQTKQEKADWLKKNQS